MSKNELREVRKALRKAMDAVWPSGQNAFNERDKGRKISRDRIRKILYGYGKKE